jgi:hypothetical protein
MIDNGWLRSFVLSVVKPLKSGKIVNQSGANASMDNLQPDGGVNDRFRLISPFGVFAKIPKGITGFYQSLYGSGFENILLGILHINRPEPLSVGDVIFYSTDASGKNIQVKMSLKNNGTLEIQCPLDFTQQYVDGVITSSSTTINASSKFKVTSPEVELGTGTVEIGSGSLEKTINGETFLELYNEHVHYDSFGLPTSPVPMPMVAATHLSTKVKVSK